MIDDEPQWLYRIYADHNGKGLLYVGVSASWPRRMTQHKTEKDWFAEAARVDVEMYPDRASVLAAEEAAIKAERPLHNKTHNGVRVEVGAVAEVPLSVNGLAALAALAVGVFLGGRWAWDALAVRRVRILAARQGLEIEVPKVPNPFAQDPPTALQLVFYASLAIAGSPPAPVPVLGDADSLVAFEAWEKDMAASTWAVAELWRRVGPAAV